MKKWKLLLLVFFLGSVTSQAQKQKIALNHIAVYVTDLSKSTNFYQTIIGLDTIPEPFHDGKHTWFGVAPGFQLHLIQGAAGASPLTKNSHLCFSVGSIETFIAGLKKGKINYENWAGEKDKITKRVDGVQQIYFKDPDGYWIEVNDDVQK